MTQDPIIWIVSSHNDTITSHFEMWKFYSYAIRIHPWPHLTCQGISKSYSYTIRTLTKWICCKKWPRLHVINFLYFYSALSSLLNMALLDTIVKHWIWFCFGSVDQIHGLMHVQHLLFPPEPLSWLRHKIYWIKNHM